MEGREEKEKEFKVLLQKHLGKRLDALNWLLSFWHLGHQWDDLIDITERRADNHYIAALLNKYIDVLSAPFYHRYLERLYPIIKVVHHVYHDSIAWEHSDVEWKATFADVFRCSGSHLIIAVIEIVVYEETGSYDLAYESAREVSLLAKETAWLTHHDDKGEKI